MESIYGASVRMRYMALLPCVGRKVGFVSGVLGVGQGFCYIYLRLRRVSQSGVEGTLSRVAAVHPSVDCDNGVGVGCLFASRVDPGTDFFFLSQTAS